MLLPRYSERGAFCRQQPIPSLRLLACVESSQVITYMPSTEHYERLILVDLHRLAMHVMTLHHGVTTQSSDVCRPGVPGCEPQWTAWSASQTC